MGFYEQRKSFVETLRVLAQEEVPASHLPPWDVIDSRPLPIPEEENDPWALKLPRMGSSTSHMNGLCIPKGGFHTCK